MPTITALKLASVLLLGSLACGCLRIGYRELDGARSKNPDAGTGASTTPDAGGAISGTGGGPGSGAAAEGGMSTSTGGTSAGGTSGRRTGGSGGVSASSGSGTGGASTSTGGSSGAAGSGGTGSLMDAGMDAATDAGTDAATADNRCPERTDAVLCDSFDDGTYSRWDYSLSEPYGVLEQSTARVRSGGSLHAYTTKADVQSQARWCASVLDKQKSGDIWLRYYNYLPSDVVITTHFSSGVISELQEPYWGVWAAVQNDTVEIGTSYADFYPGDRAFPRDRWVCVELHIKVDATAGLLELYLDGTRVAYNPTAINTVPAMGYTNAEVGIHYAEMNQGPVEVYVEDVVLARQRVPCQ